MVDFARARRNMVDGQLRPNRVDDPRVVAAFEAVPRETFLPRKLRAIAYNDEDINLGNGRHLIEPMTLARMVQYANPSQDDTVLVLGCDTGYAAAILAKLTTTVFLLAPDAERQAELDRTLEEVEIGNVVTQTGDARSGLADQGPYNLILLAGSVPEVPDELSRQLDPGGRLVAVVAPDGRSGKLTIVTRVGDSFGRVTPFDAAIPPLPAFRETPGFVF